MYVEEKRTYPLARSRLAETSIQPNDVSAILQELLITNDHLDKAKYNASAKKVKAVTSAAFDKTFQALFVSLSGSFNTLIT